MKRLSFEIKEMILNYLFSDDLMKKFNRHWNTDELVWKNDSTFEDFHRKNFLLLELYCYPNKFQKMKTYFIKQSYNEKIVYFNKINMWIKKI